MREGTPTTEEDDPFGFASLMSSDPYGLDISVGAGYGVEDDESDEE